MLRMVCRMTDDSAADLARKQFATVVRDYAPKRSSKLQQLLPYQEGITELRRKGASYETIVDILHDIHVSVCRDTLTRFCSEVLKLTPSRPRRREPVARTAPAKLPKTNRRLAEHKNEAVGPRIANPHDI